jgi:predicted ATP-binding protein involved in virulence
MSIQRIQGMYNQRELDIDLCGKDLIVTGINGAGKTFFLKEIYRICTEKYTAVVDDVTTLRSEIERLTAEGLAHQRTIIHTPNSRRIEELEKLIAVRLTSMDIVIPDVISQRDKFYKKTSLMQFFPAGRTANIRRSDGAKGLNHIKERYQHVAPQSFFSDNLEEHLVNLKTRQAFAHEEGNQRLARSIKKWIDDFESNLSDLMEDPSVKLVFHPDELRFTIERNNLPTSDFQNLSSGYSAIFSIYSDLLIRTAYFDCQPSDLDGFIIIDELDAHLHVSLQRLILPFFKKSFPNVQFIVSTHSPFILTSVEDAIIYDLGKNQVITEDISLYSYSSVMNGLLQTPPTSVVLEKHINALSNEVSKPKPDIALIQSLVSKIEPSESMLDVVSKAYYVAARAKLVDMGQD